jgi:hypothetical protein
MRKKGREKVREKEESREKGRKSAWGKRHGARGRDQKL